MQAGHHVVHIAERAGLAAVAVDRDRLAGERLRDEVRHHAAVLRVHVRAVGVEDAHQPAVEALFAPVGHDQCLAEAFALVVASARADRVDIAPVGFGLRVDQRVAVGFRGRCEQEAGAVAGGQLQQVMGAEAVRQHDLQGDAGEIGRAGRAGQVVDLLGRGEIGGQGAGQIMLDHAQAWVVADGGDVARVAGQVVVDDGDVVPRGQQRGAEV